MECVASRTDRELEPALTEYRALVKLRALYRNGAFASRNRRWTVLKAPFVGCFRREHENTGGCGRLEAHVWFP